MWTIIAVGSAFIVGIIAGSVTMEVMVMRRECCARREFVLELLWWVEGARKAGTLDKVLPKTIKEWEECKHATY